MATHAPANSSRFRAQTVSILVGAILLIASWFGVTPPAAALPLTPPVLGSLFSFAGTRPTNLGVQAGKFAPCPTTPNCVSSQSTDPTHTIAPLSYTTAPETAWQTLQDALKAQPRTKIVQATANYLYAEATSAIMGFVDDVEFYLDPVTKVIQVRSASRLGESDLGVNRKRIETIRASFS